MPQFDSINSTALNVLPKEVLELIQEAPLPGLDSNPVCKATAKRIEKLLSNSRNLNGSLTEAGIWLLAGELDRSHEISQHLETAEGCYWHGIMHRREGDFWNAKYWFRRVGTHPVMRQLAAFLDSNQTSYEFASNPPLPLRDLSLPANVSPVLVDSCERALSSEPEQMIALQRICWLEWQFLFLYGWD